MKCDDHIYIYIYTHLYTCAADKRHKREYCRGNRSSEQDLGIIMDHKLHASQEYFAFKRKQTPAWGV